MTEPLLGKLTDPERRMGKLDRRGQITSAIFVIALMAGYAGWNLRSGATGRRHVTAALLEQGFAHPTIRRALFDTHCHRSEIAFRWKTASQNGYACTVFLVPDDVRVGALPSGTQRP